MVTQENVDNIFTYHAPDAEQQVAYEAIRQKAREFAHVLLQHVPACADQQAAIRLLRESVMTANAGVALRGQM